VQSQVGSLESIGVVRIHDVLRSYAEIKETDMLAGNFRVVTRIIGAAFFALVLVAAGRAQNLQSARMAPWTFHADWRGGYSGWMSFPLAQDVGYDPSLYTERQAGRTVLVHKFVAHGQSRAWFGFVRPLKFTAGVGTAIEARYRLHVAGKLSDLQLILAGENGHQYSTALPSGEGDHTVRIAAVALSLRAPVKVEAIVLRGRLTNPPPGSESQWVLEQFTLHVARPKEVALSFPHMDASVNGSWVSRDVIQPDGLVNVELKSSGPQATVTLYDPAGAPITSRTTNQGQKQVAIFLGDHPKPGLWRAEVVQVSAKTVFRFLVLGAIPRHGHLLLSKQRLDELSHDARYAGLRKEIHRRAQMLAFRISYNVSTGANIARMPSGPGIESAAPDELLPYLELVETYANEIAYNALDYRLNGNPASLGSARRALLAMAHWQAWSPPRFRSHGLKTYYEVGCIAQRIAFGYDLIADRLSATEKARMEQVFWKQAIEPVVQEYFLYNRDPIAASNWMANSVGGALSAAVAVAGDVPDWNQREAPAVAELEFAFEQALHGLFLGDGSEAEPTGYENFAMQGISWGMSALARLGVQPQGTHRMLAGFWWPYYNTVRPGMELDTGDFDGHLKGLSGFAWGAEYGGIPALRAFYDQGTRLDLSQGAAADQNGHHLEELPGPLDLVCCSEPARAFHPPPPSRIFPERGSAVLRSGWGADSTVISLRVGPWFNHEHHDEGSFQVAAYGQKLVDEAGYASYYTDPHYPDYFTQAAGHNTVLIDGDPFSQTAFNGRYWAAFQRPHFTGWLLASSFDYVAADLTSAYDGRLRSYRREFVFLKPDILVVCDHVLAAKAHRFSWLLHAPVGSALVTGTGHASIQLPAEDAITGASAALAAGGTNTAWTVETTPLKVSLFKNLDGPRIQPQRELVLHSPRVTATQFLVGIKLEAGGGGQQHELEAWTQAAGEGLRTTHGEPGAVVFRTGTGPLRISGATTDGSMLAWQGGEAHTGWMAVDAHYVKENGRIAFHATTPTDAAWESVPSGLTLRLHNSALASVEVFSGAASVKVEVDGWQISPTYKDGMLLLPALPPGEHCVSIRMH
jgi:hypothetical protein